MVVAPHAEDFGTQELQFPIIFAVVIGDYFKRPSRDLKRLPMIVGSEVFSRGL